MIGRLFAKMNTMTLGMTELTLDDQKSQKNSKMTMDDQMSTKKSEMTTIVLKMTKVRQVAKKIKISTIYCFLDFSFFHVTR